ncbi:MAG: hypothetical protein U0105_19985 [Candidatus Obscuribacterales bacterium]
MNGLFGEGDLMTGAADFDAGFDQQTIHLQQVDIVPEKPGQLSVEFALPKGFHLNHDATVNYKITQISGEAIQIDSSVHAGRSASNRPLLIPYTGGKEGSAGDLALNVDVHYCHKDDTGTCLVKTVRILAHVKAIGESGRDWSMTCNIVEK